VVRRSESGGHEVVLVHRPKYDDWTLPKGKLEPGEDAFAAAVREVSEETGLDCLVGPGLGTTEYLDSQGRDKVVHYWAMASPQGALAPAWEVDDACWLPLADAAAKLTYARDRDVLERARTIVPKAEAAATVPLVRHALAGNRDRWRGHDGVRPLTERGRAQAEALAGTLARRRPTLLVSSPAVRCVQTLEPLGKALGLPVQRHDALAEGAGPAAALALLHAVALLGESVACTHGDIQVEVVDSLIADGAAFSKPLRFAKGSTWELTSEHGRFTAGRYVPPPV
jgi:8-oxo-dGTP diphosphatase